MVSISLKCSISEKVDSQKRRQESGRFEPENTLLTLPPSQPAAREEKHERNVPKRRAEDDPRLCRSPAKQGGPDVSLFYKIIPELRGHTDKRQSRTREKRQRPGRLFEPCREQCHGNRYTEQRKGRVPFEREQVERIGHGGRKSVPSDDGNHIREEDGCGDDNQNIHKFIIKLIQILSTLCIRQ